MSRPIRETSGSKRTPAQLRFLEWAAEDLGRPLTEQEGNLWLDQAEAMDGPLEDA